jgi:glycerol-3-phosphate acyltransferase PlsY
VEWLDYIIAALAAYLLGSIPSGYLIGRAQGIDIRKAGSGNIGAANVMRTLGKVAGTAVLGADALKGFAACQWVAPWTAGVFFASASTRAATGEHLALIAGLAAILGHIYTCWLKFKGGKGIATTAGVFLALAPVALLLTLGAWLVAFAVTRYVSVASLTAAVVLPLMVWWRTGSTFLIGLTTCVSLLAIYKHRSNLQRLLQGTEHRFGTKRKAELITKSS